MILSAALKFWPWLLLVASNLLILTGADPALRYPAALILVAFLPGWAWLRAALPPLTDPAERLTMAVGVSLALTIVVAMGAVYLPGPISQAKILWLTNLVTLTGLGIAAWRARGHPAEGAASTAFSPRLLLPLLLVLLLAAALRLPRLGYAEFHEDEAEALMLGVRLLNGEDYALFLHRKGPAQMLLPLTFWLLANQITEALARFPFALSSILSTATLFFMGRRWFGWPAGALAALLWAINGYAIGFGRMVQYQALIFFLGPLALYCLYLAWESRQPAWQIVAALLLAVCLLAHFDALLLLPAVAYLGWLAIKPMVVTRFLPSSEGIDESRPNPFPRLLRQAQDAGRLSASPLLYTLTACLLFIGLLAAFYIPYLLDPEFSNTAAYLSQSRVKPGLLYNNLDVLQRLDKDYSSHFYLPLLVVGLVSFGVWQSRKLPLRWRWGLAGVGLLALSTALWPGLWRSGSVSVALLPWLLLLGLGFWRWTAPPVRTAWLLTGLPLIGYLFLVDDPRTHLYIAYPGLALVAGAGLARLGQWLGSPQGENVETTRSPQSRGNSASESLRPGFVKTNFYPARLSLILTTVIGGLLVASIILYDRTLYLSTESSLSDLRQAWDDSAWEWMYDDLPEAREYFGYPKREGWKAIGALRAQGHLPGDFRSVNEDFVVPIWYNFGQARSCYDTPAHFFVRTTGLAEDFDPMGYVEVGQIIREQEPRLQILSAAPVADEPGRYALEPLAEQFDRLATPRRFTQQAQPQQPVGADFGPAITFLGFDLETPTVAPGETLRLDLYWQARAKPATDYRAFVHLTDGTTLWAQQDDTPACRLPTSIWRAGQQAQGQFRLPINPDTPPGRYPLIIGLYQADTLERLPISGGAGQPGDDFLWLGDVEVTARSEVQEP